MEKNGDYLADDASIDDADIAAARAGYAERGIPECILDDTLRAMPRSADNIREALCLRLFRLGCLLFHVRALDDGAAAIGILVPNGEPPDAERCRQSLALAPNFFAKYFPGEPVARAQFFECDAEAGTALRQPAGELPVEGVRRGRPLRLGVLGSGSGSNMQSIQDAIEAGTLDAEIKIVITDVPGAKILDRAAKHGIPARHIDHAPFKTKLEGRAEDEVIAALKEADVDAVVLAGYMRVVKPKLLAAFPDRVINIHPALLPSFPGIAGWKQALDYGAKVAGCTVHFVNAGIDSGPIIVQKSVPVEDADTPESLHARIQVQEHVAYPEALRLLAADRLLICGRRVVAL